MTNVMHVTLAACKEYRHRWHHLRDGRKQSADGHV